MTENNNQLLMIENCSIIEMDATELSSALYQNCCKIVQFEWNG